MDIVFHFTDGAPISRLSYVAPYLYGTTTQNPCIFRIHESGTEYTRLFNFSEVPQGDLVLVGDSFYGLTERGVFKYMMESNTLEFVATIPLLTAITVSENRIYVVSSDNNRLSSMDLDGSGYTHLVSFTMDTGISPTSISIMKGQLYGTTDEGGGLFRCNFDGSEFEIVHAFKTGTGDGVSPNPGFVEVDGVIYGTTNKGGTYNRGIIYKLAEDMYEILHVFGSEGDGYLPQRGLVYMNGYVYGATLFGGKNRSGIFYRKGLTSDSEYVILYHCGSERSDCAVPFGNFLLTEEGVLISCTKRGGIYNSGTLTKLLIPTRSSSCFGKGARILSLNRGIPMGIPVELLNVGDFVKTYKHGYRAITQIGKGAFINNPDVWHTCMYIGTREGFEPLLVTGGHALLVDTLTTEEREAQAVFWGREEPVIDDKILMVVPVSSEFTQITDDRVYTYYHFILENDGDDDRRYGVWANGFLTETPSKKQFNKNFSVLF